MPDNTIPAPDPITVPAGEEKTFDKRAVVRLNYNAADGSPGKLFAGLRLARWISLEDGYELHPDATKRGVVVVDNIVDEAQRVPRFNNAIRELFKTLGFMAEEQLLAAIDEEDRTPQQQARLDAALAALEMV
jgi:hypothetical protein